MDVSHPLRSLVPSLDSSVLEVLARSEAGLGTTQIARLASRGSRPGIQLVLDRMTEHGLVWADPTNRGYTYRLNRAHLLVPAVLAALGARRELLSRLRIAVGTLNPEPLHASVFGSFARGDGDESSDIDLLLLMPSDPAPDDHWERQLRELEDQVHSWTGNRLETLILDPETFADAAARDEPILHDLRADAVTVHGPDLDSATQQIASRALGS